jgi:hypothetical protein
MPYRRPRRLAPSSRRLFLIRGLRPRGLIIRTSAGAEKATNAHGHTDRIEFSRLLANAWGLTARALNAAVDA